MVFSSLIFLFVFLPMLLAAYYAAPSRWKNAVLLAASYVFYAWGAPRFVMVLLGSSLVDYCIGRLLGSPEFGKDASRRRLLALSIVTNVGLLAYFKYANFFVGQANGALTTLGMSTVSWTAVALPVGISFFTFHKVSYLVDVYRGIVKPARSLTNYLLYIVSFPQLIAGPIIRYHDVAEQLVTRAHTSARFLSGVHRFCAGLGKKVLIANVLGEVADRCFGAQAGPPASGDAWLGVLCYSFQIFFDFSGYSDMAIGLGRMFGFEFLENFRHPYIAQSFTEFWRRWHISLSNWMREYLYVPLGGNRGVPWRNYLNLWIVFVLSGFWHGAAWNFVVWGMYHGLFLTLDKVFGRGISRKVPGWVAMPSTFLLVMFGWVFFRSDTLGGALRYLGAMFVFGGGKCAPVAGHFEWGTRELITLVVAAALSFWPIVGERLAANSGWDRVRGTPWAVPARFITSMILLLLSASSLVAGHFNPFIYFRF